MKKKPVLQRVALAGAVMSAAVLMAACATLSLQEVEFAWPVESVLKVGDDNMVKEGRHALRFSVASLAEAEFENPNALRGKEIRLLRGNEGMYYVTGTGFRHVYVMSPDAHELRLYTTHEVSATGLKSPALNQREPYVELLDGSVRMLMNSDELIEEQNLRAEGRQ